MWHTQPIEEVAEAHKDEGNKERSARKRSGIAVQPSPAYPNKKKKAREEESDTADLAQVQVASDGAGLSSPVMQLQFQDE